MPDLGNDFENSSYQAVDSVKGTARKGVSLGRKAVARTTSKATNTLRRGMVKGGKAAAKGVANLGKLMIKIMVKIISSLISMVGVPMLVIFALLLVCVIGWNFLAEERGANESNDLYPGTENPVITDTETGVTAAIAMTEPQAVIDAYYKYMSTTSFTKTYNDKLYVFNEPSQTQDFAGLRDYFDKENNFYLSDDFIRMVDEMLHDGSFYYPEQVVKPVYGEKMELVDQDGDSSTVYTARLPVDFNTGANSTMLNEDVVKGFKDMLVSESFLDTGIGDDKAPNLIAKSQTPGKTVNDDGIDSYELRSRNVVENSASMATEPGVWDYGFGSVLQYQPAQKISYIECSYNSVDADIDVQYLNEETGEWSDSVHSHIHSFSISDGTSLTDLRSTVASYCNDLSSDTAYYSYSLPTNISAILSSTTAWNMSVEPNSAEEAQYAAVYNRTVTNSHIDAKVEDSKDVDIDRMVFSDPALQSDYQNLGGGLYPLKVPVISHAATFSGNIHYTIIPAGEEGCVKVAIPLEANTVAEADHREPVTLIRVAGGCSTASGKLTASRTGSIITMLPDIRETTAPWGFEYLQQYVESYTNYVPADYMDDRDFFLRTGIKAAEGTDEKDEYLNNLKFLMDLGLLRLYNGNISLSAVGSVNYSDMGDPSSDLYILSHLIAVEAGPGKLDKLMVGSVFMNRVASSRYPNTAMEVLSQPNQYSTYPGRWNQPGWEPTETDIACAMQVLSGEFAIPENVVGQSAHIQGTIYKVVDNGPGYYTHYYCTGSSEAVSTVDRFGRPAPSADQLEGLADRLDGVAPEDISSMSPTFDLSTSAFIGDSLTIGLNNTAKMSDSGAKVIAETSAGLRRVKTLIEESSLDASVQTVYLLAGTNSCTDADSTFRSQYMEILSAIGAKAPGARIILTSLPPCIDGAGHNASNAYISAKNAIISEIASSSGLQIVDIWSSLQKNGSLDPAYSADGLHLTATSYNLWFNQVKGGVTGSSIGAVDPATAFSNLGQDGLPVLSNYTLYEISSFDTLTAVNMQAHVVQADSTAKFWLSRLVDTVMDGIEFITQFWDSVSDFVFASENDNTATCFYVGKQYQSGDVRGVVYQSITFANQVWYSTAESKVDELLDSGDITFLFVGKDAMLGLGTLNGAGMTVVPGVGTTVEGLISPTTSYYAPLTSYNGTSMELSVPAGTNVLAVGDGKIISVNDNAALAGGKSVTQEVNIGGDTYQVTYGYLDTISVAESQTVSQGGLIGTSGKRSDGSAAMYLKVTKNGVNVDPSGIFYQSTIVFGGGSLGGDLYNADGTVNEEKIHQLQDQLSSIIGLSPGKYSGYSKSSCKSAYHTEPINSLQGLQCTWWAWGRGYEYLCTIKNTTITKAQYRNAIRGNGGEYYANNVAAGLFNYGSVPKPNSLVCYSESGDYGHIAYVEAVDYVNKVYYTSECGSGVWWLGVHKRSFDYVPGSSYKLEGFIYLDEPRI